MAPSRTDGSTGTSPVHTPPVHTPPPPATKINTLTTRATAASVARGKAASNRKENHKLIDRLVTASRNGHVDVNGQDLQKLIKETVLLGVPSDWIEGPMDQGISTYIRRVVSDNMQEINENRLINHKIKDYASDFAKAILAKTKPKKEVAGGILFRQKLEKPPARTPYEHPSRTR